MSTNKFRIGGTKPKYGFDIKFFEIIDTNKFRIGDINFLRYL